MIIDERLYVVVDNALLRQQDYWQNFINGKIELCTSHVTDMSDLFAQSPYFNYDISQWDTRRVTNMDRMFKGA
ncbi:BspA family leucine-rich repeat surface protein, partial [Vibrio neptunius]|uniref:BspA family leucine-rich repeat surface protein n=1 Tax=Vibrio neptunius TaxID=170651 RepID=UPI0039EC8259